MSILESLLLDKEQAEKLVEENVKKTLRATAAQEVKQLIKESMQMDEDEDEDDNMGDVDYSETMATDDGTELDVPPVDDAIGDLGDADIETDVNMDGEIDVDGLGTDLPDEDAEDSIDLSNADMQEVLNTIEDILSQGKDVTLQVQKQTSYDVDVTSGEEDLSDTEDLPDMLDTPDGDDMEDTEDVPDMSDTEEVEDDEDDELDESVNMKNMGAEQVDENCEDNEVYSESKKNNQNKRVLSEQKVKKALAAKNQTISEAHRRIKALQSKLKGVVTENAKLKNNESTYIKVLKESKKTINDLTLVNTNLANISSLFLENTTSKQEKKEILKAFDEKVSTLNESNLLYEMYNKTLKKKVNNELPTKEKITENAKNQKKNVKKKIIKEEKTFVDDTSPFSRLAFYESKS